MGLFSRSGLSSAEGTLTPSLTTELVPTLETPINTSEKIGQRTEDIERGQELIAKGKERAKNVFSRIGSGLKSTFKIAGNLKSSIDNYAARAIGAGARGAENLSNKGTELIGKIQRGYEKCTGKIKNSAEKLSNRVQAAKNEVVMNINDKKIDKRYSHIAAMQEELDRVADAYIDTNEQQIQQNIAEAYASGEGITEALDQARDFEINKYNNASEMRAQYEAQLQTLVDRRDALRNRIGHSTSEQTA